MKRYYIEFLRQQKDLPKEKQLKIALIYSFGVNEEEQDGNLIDEDFDTGQLDKSSREFLDDAIKDYNQHFGTSFDTSSERFQNYYKDLSYRVKNREVDLLLVVNMFLTGFDVVTLNTLWVDKNLRYHGLLQAFSRTNRILNSVKKYGNIICFRNLEQATNEALAIFGSEEAIGIVLLKTYNEYYNGYDKDGKHQDGYVELINKLQGNFSWPMDIISEKQEKEFINSFGNILRLRNILSSFDEFSGNEILTDGEFKNYQSKYIDLYDKFRKSKKEGKEEIYDDIVFEIELIKHVEVNIDYIMLLVAEYHKNKDQKTVATIRKEINSSLELRSKKELIENFINSLNSDSDIEKDWKTFRDKNKELDLQKIIQEEKLQPEQTDKFIKAAFRDGQIKPEGMAFANILPKMSTFGKENASAYDKKKAVVLEKLQMFFEKYFGI